MSLTVTEEALVRQLIDQQAAILSLASSESTIISKLGATKVTLADLTSASVINDADLFLIRQGTTEKSVAGSIIKSNPDSSETVKGIVELATSAETQAGTDSVRAIHPAGFMSCFAKSLASNGYQKLPGGLIVQWGAVNTNASGDASITFPISFPSNYQVVLTYQGINRNNPWVAYAHSKVLSGFQVYSFLSTNGAAQGLAANWIAIGY